MKFSLLPKSTATIVGFLVLAPTVYFGSSYIYDTTYDSSVDVATTTIEKVSDKPVEKVKEVFVATHVATPSAVKGIYMSACVASSPSWRKQLAKFIDDTELNSVVIDIKDYTGTVSFNIDNPEFVGGGGGCRVKDMREFIAYLHGIGIYVIGRITVFQDPYYTKLHPNLAVQSKSTGGPWKDHKGLSFIDVGAKPFWDYIVTLSKESYNAGFDELNFDYIRFPSDGNMSDTNYTWAGTTTKSVAVKKFWQYLHENVSPTGVKTSADLFGMVTTNTDDLNIGQVIENAFPYFDFIDPMVYPSHYPPHFNGWSNPNQHVYEVVNFSMSHAVERAKTASTTPLKLRPWLQDFDYGGNYGEAEVRAQIKATYDAGLTSWLIWDPGNKYTRSAFDLK